MFKNYIISILFFYSSLAFSQAFITTWKTDNPGASEDNQITIPTFPGEIYDYSVDWGDGSSDSNVTGDITHTYAASGIYQVSITGAFRRIYFDDFFGTSGLNDNYKIISIDNWGTNKWSSMSNAFAGCGNLDLLATDIPDLSDVIFLSGMFASCTSLVANPTIGDWNVSAVRNMFSVFLNAENFNQDIGNWDVSNVIEMGQMFAGARKFNQDIGNWDVSSVIGMQTMFALAESFNKDISQWDVGNVESIGSMFSNAAVFNVDIGDWNVGKVRFMSNMFAGASLFNQDIGSWNVSQVTSMASMFANATSFNQDIGNWEVSQVTDMGLMFQRASAFDQDLSNWDVSKVTRMERMFMFVSLSQENYDNILIGWASLPSLQNDVEFSAGNSNFCLGESAKSKLINEYGWTITDGGKGDCPFITTWKTDNPGVSEDNQITIPTFVGETYNYTIDWGDGTSDTNITGDITHTYSSPGVYQISISGIFPRIYFNDFFADTAANDSDKLITVEQWGTIEWSSMESAFAGCENLNVLATDIPDLSAVNSLHSMFSDCFSLVYNESINNWDISNVSDLGNMFTFATVFNQPLGNWDTRNVFNLTGMFFVARAFNQPIDSWSTDNVETMAVLFASAESFNQPINSWNTSKVTNMNGAFQDAASFDQPLDNWNVSNVMEMANMFSGAEVFNQNIASWDTSNVSNMSSMFREATLFDQNLRNWDVSNAVDMSSMFSAATSFNQSLGNWNILSATNMDFMFSGAGLSLINYDRTLNAWANLPTLQNNVIFKAGSSRFCESSEARQFIIDTYGWTITDAGEHPLCNQDNDADGVFDHKDACLNTLPGATVNANGCDSIPNDAIQVYVLTPSCIGSSDGAIEVTMDISGYLLDISVEGTGISNQFNDKASDAVFKIDNLPVGDYTITVSIPEILFEQTYGVSVNELNAVSGKRDILDSKGRTVSYTIWGSKTYEVTINGQSVNYTFDNTRPQTLVLENLNGQNDIVISGESNCQGKIIDSFFIGDTIQIYPTISASNINLLTSNNTLKVRIYSIDGRLVRELDYDQPENKVDISSLESGLYFFRMTVDGREETLKIIKR